MISAVADDGWREPMALTTADLHRIELMIAAFFETVLTSEACGCAERALDAGYEQSEHLSAERGIDGRMTEEFLRREFDAFSATLIRLLATTADHFTKHTGGLN